MRSCFLNAFAFVCVALSAVSCQAQKPPKDKWVFTTGNTLDAKGKAGFYQELTVIAEETPEFKREGKTPQLTLLCSTLTHSRIKFVLSNAGIFNTYFQPSGQETSMVNLRWESRDGVASSFVETVWDKVPAHDMLSYDPSDATVRLTLSSETLLLEPSGKVGPAGIARFDIRGLQDHISQMAICAKQLTKDSGTK